ncbi:MAG: Mrp/NBP35 family ATP-binding protein [Firmicutes bacterium]|nr:Mrp/NBP35 family ATP-binding protein [Bacillota bacterium]
MAIKSDFEKIQNLYGIIKHTIAVMSGKGGVGKSSIAALLAAALNRKGFTVGILDADITGPSIPKVFGIKGSAEVIDNIILPRESGKGVKLISINLLLEKEEQPVIWRGPLIAGTVKQFYEQVDWGDLDFLVVDLPPGTGDVPLTVMQSIPLDGIIVVSSPQELVALIVKKAIHMAEEMNIPILGLIENMSYFECPECSSRTEIFGKSQARDVSQDTGIPLLGRLPILPKIAQFSDEGKIEAIDSAYPGVFEEVVNNLIQNKNLSIS